MINIFPIFGPEQLYCTFIEKMMKKFDLSKIFNQSSWVLTIKILAPAILFLSFMAVVASVSDIRFYLFSIDVIQLTDLEPYIGVLSRIGIMFWCATAAILFFSSWILKSKKEFKQQTMFLFWGGLFTLLLVIDDFFMMHEKVLPDLFNSRYVQLVPYFIYAVGAVAIFYFYHKILLNSDSLLFILAVVFMGISIGSDLVPPVLGIELPFQYYIEDGCKFLGIIAWFAYFTRTSYKSIKMVGQINT